MHDFLEVHLLLIHIHHQVLMLKVVAVIGIDRRYENAVVHVKTVKTVSML